MYLSKEQAVSAVSAFNGIGKSKELTYKDHLQGNWGWYLCYDDRGDRDLWISLIKGPLNNLTEEGAKELLEKIYRFWYTTPYGEMDKDAPNTIPDTHQRLIDVGLIKDDEVLERKGIE